MPYSDDVGFSISPLELPLTSDLFIAKFEPFWGNFGVFEDSLPDGYGGEHATSANNKGLPTIEDLLVVGESIRISREKGQVIIDSMLETCRDILAERFR